MTICIPLRLRRQKGIALVEVTIVLPFLLMLLAIIVDFGRIFYEVSLLQGRVNSAARYLAMNTEAGTCKPGKKINYCRIAKNLVLHASPESATPAEGRFGDVTTKKYKHDEGHWQVSATYKAEFILSGLLPDEVDDLEVTLYAIQRSVNSAPETAAPGGEVFYGYR